MSNSQALLSRLEGLQCCLHDPECFYVGRCTLQCLTLELNSGEGTVNVLQLFLKTLLVLQVLEGSWGRVGGVEKEGRGKKGWMKGRERGESGDRRMEDDRRKMGKTETNGKKGEGGAVLLHCLAATHCF